ncbi:glutathione-dependent formaldehyde-activating protein [Nitzschia inconspicua]|uniref:Glutathione-dependent formaldehyde-activating protein n=1 Tax=Nitzschia inconspicua TaxID=303405 RepID=A0A9K3PB71_9STRA|nr:glutathione-dependent formaldehyde-activating protein [Nitzschia inconspicua]
MGNTESTNTDKGEYRVACHCGRIAGRFACSNQHVVAWDCNCSDCYMRGNIHIIVPEADFRLDMPGKESFEAATIEYLWGQKIAKRQFCKTCGILPWYRPRSNPDGYGITLKCIDWGSEENIIPKVEIRTFDGKNWDESFQKTGIAEQSKPLETSQ